MSEDIGNIFGAQEDVVVILKQLLEDENIELKTDLNNEAIRVLAKAKWITEREKLSNKDLSSMEILTEIVVPYVLKLKTSNGRKSRGEIVDAVKNMNHDLMKDRENMVQGMFNK